MYLEVLLALITMRVLEWLIVAAVKTYLQKKIDKILHRK
jgi:hypothetical protein